MPQKFYKDLLNQNDFVIVTLEHIDYYMKLLGRRSPFGYAAYAISKLKEPLSAMRGEIGKLKGIGKTSLRVINEIVESGSSRYYDNLMLEMKIV